MGRIVNNVVIIGDGPSITPLMTASQWKSGALWPMRTFPSMDILTWLSVELSAEDL